MLSKMRLKTLLIVVFVFSIPFIQKVFVKNSAEVDVLFCTYDIGDSNPMKRVMKELESLSISYRVLALGKSADVFRENPNHLSLELPDLMSTRETPLSDDLLRLIENAVKPKMVIAGMASAGQAQVLNFFKGKGAYTIAFYDNFDSPVGKEYIQAFLRTVIPIDEYFLPSETTLPGFQKLDATKQAKLSVLGQPVLEDWDDIFAKTDRKEFRSRLGLTEQDQTILFVGGYDDTYAVYFRLFVDAMRAFPDQKVIVTYHPKTNGSLEKSIIAEENVANIQVIDGPSTAKVATIADVLVCHKSSVGVQALYVGLPVVSVVKKGDLKNFAIDQGLAVSVETEQDLVETLQRILSAANRNYPPVQGLGIPKEATKKMGERVKEILKER